MIVSVMRITRHSAVGIWFTICRLLYRTALLHRTTCLILIVLLIFQNRMVVTIVSIAGHSSVLIGLTGSRGLLGLRSLDLFRLNLFSLRSFFTRNNFTAFRVFFITTPQNRCCYKCNSYVFYQFHSFLFYSLKSLLAT